MSSPDTHYFRYAADGVTAILPSTLVDCQAVRLEAFNAKHLEYQKCYRALTLAREHLSYVLPADEKRATKLQLAINATDRILCPDPYYERMRLNGLSFKAREEKTAIELATELGIYSVVDGVEKWEFDKEFLQELARRLIAYGRAVPEQPK